MEASGIKEGAVIENVVNLDLRTATKASVARIRRIGNVVNLLYTPETAHLITELNVGNIVNPFEVSAEAVMHHGRIVLNHATFGDVEKPLSMAVLGEVIVDADVTQADIGQGLKELYVAGQLICPDHLASAIASKVRGHQGPMHVYPRQAKPILGKLKLDEQFLRSLNDGTELMVVGKLSATEVLPNDLLERKIKAIHVADGVVCREENAEVLLARLERKSGADRVTVIPAGHHLVERALVLNANLLSTLPTRKLYCTELVRIDEDVTADALDKGLDSLVCKEMLICPAGLADVLSRKLDVLETESILYEGTLWLVDGQSDLTAARFEFLEGRATLVVLGKASIAADVAPKTLVDRLAKVHNYGFIDGSRDQIAALQFRLGADEGKLAEVRPGESQEGKRDAEDSQGGRQIQNIVNLKL